MIWVFGMGCWDSRRARKASAGGQLEQPSEVNSSTTTGTGADADIAFDLVWRRGRLIVRPVVRADTHPTRIKPKKPSASFAKGNFMGTSTDDTTSPLV